MPRRNKAVYTRKHTPAFSREYQTDLDMEAAREYQTDLDMEAAKLKERAASWLRSQVVEKNVSGEGEKNANIFPRVPNGVPES